MAKEKAVEAGMGWLDFFASVLGSLAWPVAAFAIALVFHRQINMLLGKVKTLKWGEAAVDFAEKLDEIEETAPVSVPSPDAAHVTAAMLPDERTQQLIALSPAAAIVDAWKPVEMRLHEISFNKPGLTVATVSSNGGRLVRPASQTMRQMLKDGAITASTFETLQKMLRLRNAAAHDGEVNAVDAIRFYNLATEVMRDLDADILEGKSA